jgi:eight-cysteine-cluster-containing protein
MEKTSETPKESKSYTSPIGLIVIIIIILVIVGALARDRKDVPRDEGPVACTMEAKLCPDGSSVGRVGPRCEFAACPGTSTPNPRGGDTKTPTDKAPTTPTTGTTSVSYNKPVTLKEGETAKFSDGMSVRIKSIDDSRCKPNVQCIWAGELSAELSATGGLFGRATQTFRIGTTNTPSYSTGGYQFTLDSATASSVTIIVLRAAEPVATSGCYVGGCSGQICSDQKDVLSTCEYRETYACYKTATCERQSNGKCGWTSTRELNTCLAG